MSRLAFAKAIRRHVDCPDETIDAATLREAFDHYFNRYPAVRSYVVDEHGTVRKHIAVFVNGQLLTDRRNLDLPLAATDEVHVFQALSGG
jgi:sulfur-carrier protein